MRKGTADGDSDSDVRSYAAKGVVRHTLQLRVTFPFASAATHHISACRSLVGFTMEAVFRRRTWRLGSIVSYDTTPACLCAPDSQRLCLRPIVRATAYKPGTAGASEVLCARSASCGGCSRHRLLRRAGLPPSATASKSPRRPSIFFRRCPFVSAILDA
jgi:hypothetical protein